MNFIFCKQLRAVTCALLAAAMLSGCGGGTAPPREDAQATQVPTADAAAPAQQAPSPAQAAQTRPQGPSSRAQGAETATGPISATPEAVLVPAGQDMGTTRLAWTGEASALYVTVSIDGAAPQLFGSSGPCSAGQPCTQEAPWIVPGHRYTFVLHQGAPDGPALGQAVVTALATAQVLGNGGFEQPALGNNQYLYNPASTDWAYTDGSGLTTADSGFTVSAPEFPSGRQVAFIQNLGTVSQRVFVPADGILSFAATQRANWTRTPQVLQVRLGGEVQPIASASGAQAPTLTPPSGYFYTYAVKLGPRFANTWQTLEFAGMTSNATGDATAFIDQVAISTPQRPAYGFWADGLRAATWRSDYAVSTNVAHLSPCVFPSNDPRACPTADTTVSFDAANWYASPDYRPGANHWILSANIEPTFNMACGTAPSGPPDQNRPVGPLGSPGFGFQMVPLPAGGFEAQLGYRSDARNAPCIANANDDPLSPPWPYFALAADAVHGNGFPVAIVDQGGHRKNLQFKAVNMVSRGHGHVWLEIYTEGWHDNIRRALFVYLNRATAAPQEEPNEVAWNWSIKESSYYPGARIAYRTARSLNAQCAGVSLPEYDPSPTAVNAYDINLRGLLDCVARQGGWGDAGALPEPLPITRVEWAIETMDSFSRTGQPLNDPDIRVGIHGMTIR